MHHDDLMARAQGDVSFRAIGGSSLGHSVEWGMPAVRMCVLLSDPPCYVRLIILSHTTHTMIHDNVTSATGYTQRQDSLNYGGVAYKQACN